MARVEPETLADRDLIEVFIARTLDEARRVEGLLTDRGVDYVVQVELFGRTLFGSPRYGAMFYVTVGQAQYCRSALAVAGFEQGIVEEDSET